MIIAFSFQAKPSHGKQLEALLNDPDTARKVAEMMGARRNLLLWQGDRMTRILEFDDGVTPVPLAELARKDENVRAFLKRVGALTEPAFDPDDEAQTARFNEKASMRVLYDVQV